VLRQNAAPTAHEMYAIAADALKQSKMARGEPARRKKLREEAKKIYEEARDKFPKAYVPLDLAEFHYTGKITIDEISELLDLSSWDKIREYNDDYLWESGRQMVDEDEFVDDEQGYQDAVDKASASAEEELFGNWHNSVSAAADRAFSDHGLVLTPLGKARYPWQFKVTPAKLWEDAAANLMDTINGVGYFYVQSLGDFIASGPYGTARIAVLAHLGSMKSRPSVYGDRSYKTTYEAQWR